MVFFFILAIILIALIVLVSIFAPHKLPWYRPHLVLNPSEIELMQKPIQHPVVIEGLVEPERRSISLEDQVLKLESILTEKNRAIEKLQKQVTAERNYREEFDKLKTILDKEISQLRAHNKELKAKIGGSDA
jgi:hypothetical protein